MSLKHWYYRQLQERHLRQSIARLRKLEQTTPVREDRVRIPFAFRGKGFFKRVRPMQSEYEIRQLYQLVLARRPKRVLEIGTCHGGTLYLWCQAADPAATVLSLDLPEGEFGGGYAESRTGLYQAFAQPGQSLHLLRADSHAEDTCQRVRQLLGPQPLDFLFIDGDHTYEGVKRDFLLYNPLVGPDGCVALHDIAPRPELPRIEVWRFWQELKGKASTASAAAPLQGRQLEELLDPTPGGQAIGIGLIHRPR